MALGVERKDIVMVAVLLAGALLAVLNQTLLSPALPSIMADLEVSSTTVQWMTSGYALVEAVVIPLSAYLIGRFTTRQLYISAFAIFAVGSLAAALAPSFWVLLVGRILQAICTGMAMPMVFTVILLIFPREKRGTAMGIVGLIMGFAPAVGPSVGGLLVDSIGWRALFVVSTVLCVVIIILAVITLRNYGNFKRTAFDALSVVLSTIGLVCLLYGLSSLSSSANVAVPAALIVVGIVVLAIYACRQVKLPEPMLNVGILKSGKYATSIAVIAFLQATIVGMSVVLPLYIQGVCGYSATMSGFAMLPGALAGAVVGFFAGRLFDRFGVRKVAIPGAFVAIVGGALLSILPIDGEIVVISLAYMVLMMGVQAMMTPSNTWGLNSLSNSMIQHAQSLTNTINQVAASLGTVVLVAVSAMASSAASGASSLEQSYAGSHASFTVVLLLMVAVCVIVLFLVTDKKKAAAGDGVDAASQGAAVGASAGADAAAEDAVCAAAAEIDPYRDYKAKDLMTRDFAFAQEGSKMRDVIKLMAANDTSGLPVVDADGSLVGFISDGDVASYLGKNEMSFFDTTTNFYRFSDDEAMQQRLHDLMELSVDAIATKRVISVDVDAPVDDVCHVLAEKRIKKVPVVKDGRLVGTLSRRNIVRAVAAEIDAATGEGA